MRTFFIVWTGQLVSMIGSMLTWLGLGIWVFVETGSTSRLALILLAAALPAVIVTPFAGTLVDRWDRRTAMLLSDTGAALGTLAIAVLLLTDQLEIWHLYVALSFSSVFGAFQFPAYSAAVTMLVPKQHYGRAAGLVSLAQSASLVIAPVLAGVLLVSTGLEGLIMVDVATFVVAVITLVVVRFPRPVPSEAGEEGTGSLWQETRYGVSYLMGRRALLYLVVFIGMVAVLGGFANILLFPLVLAFAGEAEFGSVVSIGSIGLVVGSLVMSAWGGPKRRIHGVLGFLVVLGAGLILMGARPSLFAASAGLFVLLLAVPFVNGSNQAIFQAKVEPDVQGRVFAIRRLFAEAGQPLAFVAAVPLADRVFEPLLAADGALAGTVGDVIGTGDGRGVAFLFICLGMVTFGLVALGYASPRLRNVEDEIPDVVADPAAPTSTGNPGPIGLDDLVAREPQPEPAT